jgi:hypothetical protein
MPYRATESLLNHVYLNAGPHRFQMGHPPGDLLTEIEIIFRNACFCSSERDENSEGRRCDSERQQ